MPSVARREINVRTPGRGAVDITREVAAVAAEADADATLCHLFIRHTSASLMICENADPNVLRDLETFMGDLAPDGDPRFVHRDEGPDDMPAHVRSILTQTELTIPVDAGRLLLGTWQGIFVWEHRTRPHERRVIVTVG